MNETSSHAIQPPSLLCPACRVDLLMMERQGIEIDYCPKCRGVWLDRGELDKIIERSAQDTAPGAAVPQGVAGVPPAPPPSFLPPLAPQQPPGTPPYAAPPSPWGAYPDSYGNTHGSAHEHHGDHHGSGHGRRHGSFLSRLFD